MNVLHAPEGAPSGAADETPDLIDYRQLLDYAGFVTGALRRRRRLALAAFASVVALVVTALLTLPKSYHVETKILAQRNQVIASLGNPNRAVPGEADAPTRAAAETVMRRDNLVSLIKQTELTRQWDASRAPALRLKDFVLGLFRGDLAEEDKVDALVGFLEKKLFVATGEGTVTIGIDWPDAVMAYRLVEGAQQNFLEARHVADISSIAEAISILDGHAAQVHEMMNATFDEARRVRRRGGVATAPLAPLTASSAADQEIAQLAMMLNAKRRAIKDLEEFRQRRLAELQAQLAEQRAVYADAHPSVTSIRQSLDALAQESPQLAALRREEREIESEYLRRGGTPAAAERAEAPPQLLPMEIRMAPESQADTPEGLARERLKATIAKYNSLLDRIDSARIELDTARAAFKYRYSVIRPAQLPKRPAKPNAPLVLVGGLLGGVVLAVLAAVAADLRAGVILEAWQVERILGVPVLAVIRRS